MARTDLAERVHPALHGLTETAGSAASDVAEAWREKGAPAAAAFMVGVRDKAGPTAVQVAGTMRDKAVPALRDHAVPAAIAAGHVVRQRGVPMAQAAWTTTRVRLAPATATLRDRLGPVFEVATPAVSGAATAAGGARRLARSASKATEPQRKQAQKKAIQAARKADKATKPHRKEALRRAREVQRAARGERHRNLPLMALIFVAGAAAGAGIAAGVGALLRRRSTESEPTGFQESLNGAHSAETQSSSPADDQSPES